MIDAYLDESGVHQGASVCSIVGYFAGPGQWRNFAGNWRRTLSKYDVPHDKFHAKELFQRSEFFRKWDTPKHKKFLSDIARTILKYRLRAVSVGLAVDDFLSCSLPQRRFLTGARMKVNKLVSTGNPTKPYSCRSYGASRMLCNTRKVGKQTSSLDSMTIGRYNGLTLTLTWTLHLPTVQTSQSSTRNDLSSFPQRT